MLSLKPSFNASIDIEAPQNTLLKSSQDHQVLACRATPLLVSFHCIGVAVVKPQWKQLPTVSNICQISHKWAPTCSSPLQCLWISWSQKQKWTTSLNSFSSLANVETGPKWGGYVLIALTKSHAHCVNAVCSEGFWETGPAILWLLLHHQHTNPS